MLSTVTPLDVVELPVDAARGLALAAAVIAPEDVPPFVNSAVDGYAVRSADVTAVPVELRVVDEVAAGAASDHVLVDRGGDPDHDRRARCRLAPTRS